MVMGDRSNTTEIINPEQKQESEIPPTPTSQATSQNTVPPQPEGIHTEQEKSVNIFDFKRLKWYEWLAMLPAFVLIVLGGAFGALFGILGWGLSLKVIRNESYSKTVKILFVVGITIAYYLIYFISGSFYTGFIKGILG